MIKKFFVSVTILGVLLTLSSCRSAEKTTSSISIDGEWTIVEINGANLSSDTNKPFIGIDTAKKRMFGNSGCNRMMGQLSFEPNAKKISFSSVATTRMACMNMIIEENILNTLKFVQFYRVENRETLLLCNGNKRPIVVLEKKQSLESILSSLSGKWMIKTLENNPISVTDQESPFLSFDTAESRIHGNLGCNIVNGSFSVDPEKIDRIHFSKMISTMRACPDMDLEQKLLKAVESVSSFKIQPKGLLNLYDEENNLLVTLEKED